MQVDGMLEVFTCPICLEYADEAVSTTCCQQVYCTKCILDIPPPGRCPSCRSNDKKVSFVQAVAIRRALERLPTTCPNNCGTTDLKRGNLKTHLTLHCTKRLLPCPCPTCTAPSMSADTLPQHIATIHSEQLITHASRLFQELPPPPTPVILPPTAPPSAPDTRIESLRNVEGRMSRLGITGMRYCGGNLPKPSCGCCNGKCGPGSGCACLACMILELNTRKLPPGWLINNKGASCRKGTTGYFYCGRKSEKPLPGSDGWCGPTDGPQCGPCAILQALAPVWYLNVDALR